MAKRQPKPKQPAPRLHLSLAELAIAPVMTSIIELRAALGSPDPARVRRALDQRPFAEPDPRWVEGLSDPTYINRKISVP
jgi:hypothetical protein